MFNSYNGWLDAMNKIWKTEGAKGMFRGSIPRITWYIPASALTFMAVEFLRQQFNEKLDEDNVQEVTSLAIEKPKSSFKEVAWIFIQQFLTYKKIKVCDFA